MLLRSDEPSTDSAFGPSLKPQGPENVHTFRRSFLLAVFFVISASGADAAEGEHAGFVPLYNGKDLSGWEDQNGSISAWRADGPILSCIKRGGGWLRTTKMYSDFVLKVDWRLPPAGNSGVGLRFPPKGDPAHMGMEIQILDDPAEVYKTIIPAQHTGSIYYQSAAKQGAAKPAGEWNSYEITCLGPHVKVVLNGQVVSDVDVDQFTKGKGGHKALADRPKIGYVGLQSHETRVDFRNIEIKDLTTLTPSGLRYVDLVQGTGPTVAAGDTVEGHFTGYLVDGTKFEYSGSAPMKIPLSGLIAGLREGFTGMKVGGRRKLIIPPDLGFGAKGRPGKIPPDAILVFDIDVTKLLTK
jgi:FKBP-type peptidyl-prolyl cis-trans isomerase